MTASRPPAAALPIRPCRDDEFDIILAIVNRAAEAYRGRIPEDCWHEPYMSRDALASEIAAGTRFIGTEHGGALVGVMGLQALPEVDLIRHAYVLPDRQGLGIGGAMLDQLRAGSGRQVLVGTWAAALWAIAFYERHGFERVDQAATDRLLRTFWTISPRQAEVSVVLASPALVEGIV